MSRRVRIAFSALGACLVVFCASAPVASAANVYRFSTTLYAPGANGASANGTYSINGLNPGQDVKVEVRHGAAPPFNSYTQGSGNSGVYGPTISGMIPGDIIDVRQPSGGAVTETYTIPPVSATFAAGSPNVSGTVPAGMLLELDTSGACSGPGAAVRVGKTSGSFATTLSRAPGAGDYVRATLYSDLGDSAGYYMVAPGETPCLRVNSVPDLSLPPGSPSSAVTYNVYAGNFKDSIAPTTKLVQVRNGAPIVTLTGSTYISDSISEPALPGDRFDIYRPQGAPSPAYSFTVPSVRATFDPSVDLVAIDAPAASSVFAFLCRQYSCPFENGRTASDRPAGRTLLDFTKYDEEGDPLDLLPTDRVIASASVDGGSLTYSVLGTPGDLVAPSQRLKLPSRLSLSALLKAASKGYKIKVTSSEAATAALELSMSPGAKSAAKKAAAIKLASVRHAVKAGTTTLKLKFSKSGKKALKKLLRSLKRGQSRSATLTSTMTDASGNASTAVKKTKIRR